MLIAEVIATGDEIRSGALVDSNSAFIARELEQAGVNVSRHQSVGDDLETLIDTFRKAGERADVMVATGGLGPTTDDLTTEAAAAAAGVLLKLDPEALAAIEAFFRRRQRAMSASNRKQAMLPESAVRLDNPIGTAPGFMLKIGKGHLFCLPGVPAEMRRMMREQVLPRIGALKGGRRGYLLVRNISTFGLTESMTGEKLSGFAERFPSVKLGLRAKFPEIHVKCYAAGAEKERLEHLLQEASAWVSEQLGVHVLSFEGHSMETVVGKMLAQRNATVALAESCTGGLIASRLTDVAGSSDYFLFSAVVYANAAKTGVIHVAPQTLAEYGAVHEETVKEMAAGVRNLAGSTYGLSVSGIAGPSGGSDEKPVGTVCIGLATPERVKGYRYVFPFGKRLMNKSIFATAALDLLRRELLTRTEIGLPEGFPHEP